MTESSAADDRRLFDLRRLLQQWDPIGVADLVDDEYDCQLGPLWLQLTHGATRESLSGYLRSEVREHFGLDPQRCGIEAFTTRLLELAGTWTDPEKTDRTRDEA